MRLSYALVSLCCVLVAFAVAGCASSPRRVDVAATVDVTSAFYVVRRAQHTGIAIATELWPEGALRAAFSGAKYLEFGWGDARYYPAERRSVWMALDALFTPSASVMSVLGLPDITAARPDGIERVPASPSELQALVTAITGSFANFEATGMARRVIDGELRFYAAEGSFYFFRMCNHWTATRLRAAGCEVGSLPVITAGRVLREARQCAAARNSQGK